MSYSGFTLVTAASALAACSHVNYASTTPGKLSGRLDVRWIAPELFIYQPSSVNPLRFVTSEGREVVPKRMVTDGGSIPRLFWSIPGYSPWGFGPAFGKRCTEISVT